MIALGSDHGGYSLKQEVKAYLEGKGIPYKDYGCLDESPCDYQVKGIRAAVCHDTFSAQATREHNDANILAMGARVVGPGLALKIVDTFLNTEFSGEERHVNRIRQIED